MRLNKKILYKRASFEALFLFQKVGILLTACLFFSACQTLKTQSFNTPSFIKTGSSPKVQDTLPDDYFQKDFFRYDDYIYKKNIKSVELRISGWKISEPIIELGSLEHFVLSFDDLEGGYKNFAYTFIHCDAQWKPTEMLFTDYCEGFPENYIKDYSFSLNTIQKYTHYHFVFPNNNIRFTKSGNYLVQVYSESDKNDIILTRRFTIIEKLVSISGSIRKTVEVQDMESKQQILFKITQNNYKIAYPEKLQVFVYQNNRKDNLISSLKPRFIQGNEMLFDWDSGNSFNGGNEWRYFDIQTLKVNTERIAGIEFLNNEYHVFLLPDERRTYKNYYTYDEINGRHLLKTTDAEDVNIEGEYAWVHFALPYPNPIVDGNLYIYGSLTDYLCKKEAQMIYDPEKLKYYGKLYLKQGYYNYHYVILRDESNIADETYIEGNHSETNNEYRILLFYKEPGQIYDRAIGFVRIDNNNK